ncbi:class I SAM-dependent methyltransferase [Alphaproteobacteria bacterium]|nr:class I SAM-dependent methyltransferase [Alphaproteobacteria bacterium]
MSLKLNPLINEFNKIKLINKKKLIKFDQKTRNYHSIVFRCPKSNIIINSKSIYNLNNYFKESYWINNNNIAGTKIKKPKSIIDENYKRVKDFKKEIINKSILDFGSGDCSFLLKAKKYTKYLHSIDYANLNKSKYIEFNSNLENVDKRFDTIFLFHTFHYLEDPIETLFKLRKLLNKNGKIVIEVPNSDNPLYSIPEYREFSFSIESLVLYNYYSISFILRKYKINHDIFFYQRYDLNNFMFWLQKNKPGGHNKKIYSNASNQTFLKRNDRLTDSLRVIIYK